MDTSTSGDVDVKQLLEALLRLPPDKVTEVRDFVFFLQERYGTTGSANISDAWSEEDMQDLSLASLRHAENTIWGLT